LLNPDDDGWRGEWMSWRSRPAAATILGLGSVVGYAPTASKSKLPTILTSSMMPLMVLVM
jgi:hypothetical protein